MLGQQAVSAGDLAQAGGEAHECVPAAPGQHLLGKSMTNTVGSSSA